MNRQLRLTILVEAKEAVNITQDPQVAEHERQRPLFGVYALPPTTGGRT
jgi:hypothetical protein